jgi:hypothetical protein
MDKKFVLVDPKERLPEKSYHDPQTKLWPHETSDGVFAMTDNGPSIAYYDYADNKWRDRDALYNKELWSKVIYWLEEV